MVARLSRPEFSPRLPHAPQPLRRRRHGRRHQLTIRDKLPERLGRLLRPASRSATAHRVGVVFAQIESESELLSDLEDALEPSRVEGLPRLLGAVERPRDAEKVPHDFAGERQREHRPSQGADVTLTPTGRNRPHGAAEIEMDQPWGAASHTRVRAAGEPNGRNRWLGQTDIGAVARRCVDRPTLIAIAAGRCPLPWLPYLRRHLPECSRCQARVVRAAGGRLGDTVDDEYRRLPLRWLCALAVAASLVAAAVVWVRGEPPSVQTSTSMLEAISPIDGATPAPSAVIRDPPSVLADTSDPCHDFRQQLAMPPASAPHQRPSGTPRTASVPSVEPPDAADINARVGVLADGRRFRMTLD